MLHTFFSGFGQTFFIALFVPQILSEFQIGNTEFGSIYMVATLGAALTLGIVGRHIDHIKLSHYSTAVGLGLIVASLLVAWSPNLVVLTVGILLLRLCGQGLMPHITTTSIARYFHELRGRALSIATLGMPISEAALPSYAVLINGIGGWRTAFLFFGMTILLGFFPAMLLLYRRSDSFFSPAPLSTPPDAAQLSEEKSHRILRDPVFYLLVPLAVTPPFLLTGFFFHQAALGAQHGWSIGLLASCFVAYAAMKLIFSLVSGFAIDQWTAAKLTPIYVLPLAIGLSFWFLGDSETNAVLYMMFAGVTVGMENNVKSSLVAEIYGVAMLGTIRSMFATAMVASTALCPALFGLLIDRGVPVEQLAGGGIAFVLLASVLARVALAKAKKRTA